VGVYCIRKALQSGGIGKFTTHIATAVPFNQELQDQYNIHKDYTFVAGLQNLTCENKMHHMKKLHQ